MPILHLDVVADGDGAWPDLLDRMAKPCTSSEADGLRMSGLEAGMSGGDPSVTIRLDFPDGSTRIVQTSLALFLLAADVLRERYGDPRVGRP